jgi:ferredoxin
MQRNVEIFWFSGTGNTLFIARKAKEILDTKGYHCTLSPITRTAVVQAAADTATGIVVPVAVQGTFPIVWNFLKNLPDGKGSEVFLVDTLEKYSGGIKGPVKKILKKKGYKPVGAVELLMPNFFMAKTEDADKKQKIEKSVQQLASFIDSLETGTAEWEDIPLYSDIMSSFFRSKMLAKLWTKIFKKNIAGTCINCGTCVRICPQDCADVNSRHIDVKSDKCILCQRCMEYCPVNAIGMGNIPFIKNKLISLSEMEHALGTR